MKKSHNRSRTSSGTSAAPPIAVSDEPIPWWRQFWGEPAALLLIPGILLRPWLDGITYPTDNFYFLWYLALVFAIWSMHLLFTGERIRACLPIALLAGFLVVSVLTGLNTIQVNCTYRTLLMWVMYFFLFVLCSNGPNSRVGIGIILGAFCVVYLAECIWGLLHFCYVLPYVRTMVQKDPNLLMDFFGVSELTPELAHRLNTNRAFGSLLFPNALGAFVILGIPYAFASGVQAIRAMRDSWPQRKQIGAAVAESRRISYSVLIGAGSFVVLGSVAFFITSFIHSMKYPDAPWTAHSVSLIFWAGVVPLALSIGPWLLTRHYGVKVCGMAIQAIALPLISLLGLIALWLTYSRGAMIGLFFAAGFMAVLFIIRQKVFLRRAVHTLASTVMLILLLTAIGSGYAAWAQQATAPAQPAAQAPEPAKAAAPAQSAAQAPGPAAANPANGAVNPDATLNIDGRSLGLKDLSNPSSMVQRLSYWKTSWLIAKANFWTGVGLGNFKTAYPKYQPIDAADVKMAHNDYLQVLTETGIFGLLAFLAFWGYFVIWGAIRILRETVKRDRWLLAGLYVSVLAFLIHSVFDFNFYNPSLAFYAFLLMGLFFGLAEPMEPRHQRTRKVSHQLLSVPFLAIAALVAGLALRAYLTDFIVGDRHYFNVGNERVLMSKQRVGEFFLKEVRPDAPKDKPLMQRVTAVAQLIPLRSDIERFGRIFVPADRPGGKGRILGPNEAVPPNAAVVVTNPVIARQVAIAAIERWLEIIKTADSIFPYDPELAGHIASWYDLLLSATGDKDKMRTYTLEFVRWGKETVRRSPEQSWFHEWLARALWLQANIEPPETKRAKLLEALEEFRIATALYPSSALAMTQYAEALKNYGIFMREGGRAEEGAAYAAKAEAAFAQANKIAQVRGTPNH